MRKHVTSWILLSAWAAIGWASNLNGQETIRAGGSNEVRVLLVFSGLPEDAAVTAIPVESGDDTCAQVEVVQATDAATSPIIQAIVPKQNETPNRSPQFDWYSKNQDDNAATANQEITGSMPLNARHVFYDDHSTVGQTDPRFVRYDDHSTVGQFGPPSRDDVVSGYSLNAKGCCDEWAGYCPMPRRTWGYCNCFQRPGLVSHRNCDQNGCSHK
jgi:hypothetical protein